MLTPYRPKRPLSAYNIFFKEERARILAELPKEEEEDGDKKSKTGPHGKIGFENLAKTIGQRWKKISADDAAEYKKKAAVDMERYKEQMEVYLRNKNGDQKEAFVDGKSKKVDRQDDEDDSEKPSKKIKTEGGMQNADARS